MTQTRHFDLELADLKRSLVTMGNLVEQAIDAAAAAINAPTIDAREQVRGLEERLDKLDEELQERCHRALALHSPMAGDLRFLVSALQITTQLEHLGDLAEGVCKRATSIAKREVVENPPSLAPLVNLTQEMVRECLEAFLTGNTDLAGRVVAQERVTDQLTKSCYEWIQSAMVGRAERIREYTHLLRAVSNWENMADVATAIATEAVYIHHGRGGKHPTRSSLAPVANP